MKFQMLMKRKILTGSYLVTPCSVALGDEGAAFFGVVDDFTDGVLRSELVGENVLRSHRNDNADCMLQ